MKLSVKIGDEEKTHQINKKEVLIGRSSDADIQVSSENISRKHLQIIQNNSEFSARLLTENNWAICMGTEMNKDQDIPFFEFGEIELPGDIRIKLVLDGSENLDLGTQSNIKKIDLDINPKKKKAQRKAISKTKITSQAKFKEKPKSKIIPILVFIAIVFLIATYLELI